MDINPYRWMKIADIYVQPSRFEGEGITIEEAKKLEKLVIVSKGCKRENAIGEIIAQDVDDFTEKIEDIINNPDKKEKYIEEYKHKEDNLSEIEKINTLLNH